MSLKILHIPDTCTGCGACVSVCPKDALQLRYNDTGFYQPVLNPSLCINCGLCDKSCQVFQQDNPQDTPRREYYMAKAKDKDVVRQSSSGGVFTLLADKILDEGGLVIGARYNYDLSRLEQCSTDHCSMDELRKSKYIESYTGKIFAEVLDTLKQGRKVMYVGTPCQVEGLRDYLKLKRADLTLLTTVRFICHGVPSNLFFTEYLQYEEKKHRSKVTCFDFRPKTTGWRNSVWKMCLANGKQITGPYYYYYYYYFYQLSNILRKCCYGCKRVLNDKADITIADFWGIGKYRPDNKDQEGISLVIAHNDKGRALLHSAQGFEYLESIPEQAVRYIRNEVEARGGLASAQEKFMAEVKKHGYMKTAVSQARMKILKIKLKLAIRSFLLKIMRRA